MAEDDVTTSGVIGDMFDAIRDAPGKLRDEAQKIVDRMRESYAAAQRARAFRLAAVVVVGYLLLRKR